MLRPQMGFLEPWIPETSKTFLEELHKELSENHILYGADLVVIARREDRDDVLFQFKSNPDKCVQVHLTWRMDKEIDSSWPKTREYNSFNDWFKEVMLIDNKEYEE
ncbi:hypothetical protein [Paenibacillus pini]|uniref:Uncharacterized protein n=1 Tax=Paenibacillus pini JCM 16418 TaxID=1236976 RepID=W7YVZ9_9BACL|nr:hypothetical protein [Paenibacillus pini]GAF06549.1 hypothetical protein JCM16418_509 [Paenibacillus pini JCM 16418]